MNRGFSIFGRQPRVEPAPASLTGAQNGLSQVGSNVELGGNPLIHLTSFDTAGFAFQILENGNSVILLSAGGIQFGSPYVGGPYGGMELAGNRLDLVAGSSGVRYLELQDTNQTCTIGDLDIVQSGVLILIDNILPAVIIGCPLSGNNTTLNLRDNSEEITIVSANGTWGNFNIGLRLVQFGDIDGFFNGNMFVINDNLGTFDFTNGTNTATININGVNGFTGTVVAPATITVDGGIVTNVA